MKTVFALTVFLFLLTTPHTQAFFDKLDKLDKLKLDKLDPTKITEGAAKITKGATGIGIEEEMSIGGSVAIEITAMHGGVWKDADATTRVNLIGKALARYSDRPRLPYRFAILNTPDVNGYSAPGGYIFITKGAYDAVDNDDQLAAILAHEMAHVTRRHALRIISRNEFLAGVSEVASGSSNHFRQYDLSVDKVSNTLLKTGYDSRSEFDADQMGRELATNTGYTRDGLVSFLRKLQMMHNGGHNLFSTHPPLEDRIARLK